MLHSRSNLKLFKLCYSTLFSLYNLSLEWVFKTRFAFCIPFFVFV